MSFLLRWVRKAGFAEGLHTQHQEVKRALADIQWYVKWLGHQLHKEGNWYVSNIKQARRDDDSHVCEQRVEARPIWNNYPAACRVIKTLISAPIPPPIHLTNTQEVN